MKIGQISKIVKIVWPILPWSLNFENWQKLFILKIGQFFKILESSTIKFLEIGQISNILKIVWSIILKIDNYGNWLIYIGWPHICFKNGQKLTGRITKHYWQKPCHYVVLGNSFQHNLPQLQLVKDLNISGVRKYEKKYSSNYRV